MLHRCDRTTVAAGSERRAALQLWGAYESRSGTTPVRDRHRDDGSRRDGCSFRSRLAARPRARHVVDRGRHGVGCLVVLQQRARSGSRGPNMDTPAVRLWGIVIGLAILLINVGVLRFTSGRRTAGRWLRSRRVVRCQPPSLLVGTGPRVSMCRDGCSTSACLLPYSEQCCAGDAPPISTSAGAGHMVASDAVLLSLPLAPVVMVFGGHRCQVFHAALRRPCR